MSTYQLLDGLQIIEGSAFVAAPSGGMTLAQLGADVIRFDQIGGGIDHQRWPVTPEGTSLYWAGLNKGKRSVQIDLRSDEGRELARAMIAAAGTFLTNFPATGWLAYDELRAARPDLVMVAITGNHDGTTAVDYTVNCAVGYPSVTGPADSDAPVNHVLPAWDVICGQTAAVGILAADRHRGRTGAGQLVSLALSDVALATVAALGHVAEATVLDQERPRVGNDLYGAFGRDFPTGDGHRVIAVAISPNQWRTLAGATGLTDAFAALETELSLDLARNEADRFHARERIAALVEAWTGAHSLDEVRHAFDTAGVCWGPYQTFSELVAHDPRCSPTNPLFAAIDQPGIGTVLTAGTPLRFNGVEHSPPLAAPVLGADTDDVLATVLGLTGAEIGALHDRAVVA